MEESTLLKIDSVSKEQMVSDSLSRLICYKAKSADDFLKFLIREIAVKTKSRRGYALMFSESERSFILTQVFKDALIGSEDDFRHDGVPLAKAGMWISSFEKRIVLMQNTRSELFLLNHNTGLSETSERFCSLPLIEGDSVTGVLIVSDKEEDYDSTDIKYIELLKDPVNALTECARRFENIVYAKAQAEKNEQNKISYLINISHEIKTPINAIAGFSSLLKEYGGLPQNYQKYLDIILESSRNLISITNNVVEISNLESGLDVFVDKELNISDLISEVYEQFMEQASLKNLLFQTDVKISPDDCLVTGDKGKIKKVLSDLISNSLRFTYSGSIVLGCRIDGNFLEFHVSDTGSGIADANKKNIFDHFFQGGNPTPGGFKGTGLGLTISKGYVEKMGGKIWFTSAENKGSDFYFTVPYKKHVVQNSVNLQNMSGVIGNDKLKKTILVAEDDPLNFSLIQSFLSKLNVDVLRAENGKEAVNICVSRKIDLVLMDIRMPLMDGYTAARLIKESIHDQIIIAQTAYTNDRQTALANGCTDFIAKPFSRQQLISLINIYI